MKLTCVIETRIPDLRDPIIHYAQTVPGVELTEAPWTGDTTVDIPYSFPPYRDRRPRWRGHSFRLYQQSGYRDFGRQLLPLRRKRYGCI